MPKKPDRPISATIFPKTGSPWLRLDKLPTEKDQLELTIADRFATTLSKTSGEDYRCKGRAPEPGDVLLYAENGNRICLQIGEAVDIHRSRTTALRNSYGASLWSCSTDLLEIYRGVQVAFIDAGEARDLPSVFSKNGQNILQELSRELRSLRSIVNSLPTNNAGEFKGKGTYIKVSSISMRLTVRLLRYGLPSEKNPPKWLWTGTHQIRQGDTLERFTDVISKKLTHYAAINMPFWLVVYSLDCTCEPDEEASLFSALTESNHPFERVYLFFPRGSDGEVRELYPHRPERPKPASTGSKKVLLRIKPEDAIPKWDDLRWQAVVADN